MPVNIVHDAGGLSRIILTEPMGSSAEVVLNGGQVVSWKNDRREELLYMNSKAVRKPPKAIRGGMPVCFPQAMVSGSVSFSFTSCKQSLKCGSHTEVHRGGLEGMAEEGFEMRLRVSLSPGKLTLIPLVRNTDTKNMSFTFALLNYLSISDISEVRVEGLETLDYFDNLMHKERFAEQADAITFDCEVDRVYLSTPPKIAVIDHEKKRTFVLRKEGMPDAAVWNPWDKKAEAIPDMGDEDYQSMLCVDSVVLETPIILKPYEEWRGYQEISNVSSSYCSGQLDPRKVLYGSN